VLSVFDQGFSVSDSRVRRSGHGDRHAGARTPAGRQLESTGTRSRSAFGSLMPGELCGSCRRGTWVPFGRGLASMAVAGPTRVSHPGWISGPSPTEGATAPPAGTVSVCTAPTGGPGAVKGDGASALAPEERGRDGGITDSSGDGSTATMEATLWNTYGAACVLAESSGFRGA
jgi:hypothetical protein